MKKTRYNKIYTLLLNKKYKKLNLFKKIKNKSLLLINIREMRKFDDKIIQILNL